jgi:signal transduction histidine kinase
MFCGANKVIRAGIRGTSARAECRLTSVTLRGKERAEFSVYSVPIECEGEPAVFCALNDVSSEKRRAVLERAFFHDILNTAASVKGLSDLIALDRERIDGRELSKFLQMMRDSCETLVDEILSHQVLLSAETGQLHTSWGEAAIADCLREAVMVASHLPVASLKPIQPEYPPATAVFRTDRVLLGRVLLNLLKNALEATPDGQAIHVGARVTGDEVEFTVQNPAVLSQSVRLQIFQRSFTTKGAGRGIGTYAAKLLTEQYLGGEIEFRSSESEGTVFTVRLPLAARS